jgi:hypothetical protein
MIDRSGEIDPPNGELPPGRSPPERGRVAQILLPTPKSPRHGVGVLLAGFIVEGGTEVYQFLARGDLVQGPLAYYTTLATTILGFYLMFLGLREWHAYHPRPERRHATSGRRPVPWFGLGLWGGGTAMTALVVIGWGSGVTDGAPFWIAWPVGGIVVWAFGNFFFGLRKEAQLQGSPWGNGLGWAAFLWSLGVAVLAGVVVGVRAVLLLTEFFTNWGQLISSIGPIVVAMSPLFVAYCLVIGAFGLGLLASRNRPWPQPG